jgi:hypothetical protein
MTLDQFNAAVREALAKKFGDRLGKMTVVTDNLHVRPRWLLFAWVDGRAPTVSFPFATGSGDDEPRQFDEFIKRTILTLARKPSRGDGTTTNT